MATENMPAVNINVQNHLIYFYPPLFKEWSQCTVFKCRQYKGISTNSFLSLVQKSFGVYFIALHETKKGLQNVKSIQEQN